MHIKPIVCFLLFVPCCLAIAETPSTNYLKNFEISLGAGEAFFTSNNGLLPISSTETDNLSVAHVSSNPIEKIGVGYYFFNEPSQRKFFTDLLAEVNIYHVNTNINGTVFPYQQSSLDNYNFQAPVTSNRVMLDFKPTLFTAQHFSGYPILGVGVAFNKLSYSDTPSNNAVPSNTSVNLNSYTNRRIAYDVGLGMNYRFTTHLKTSLEYLYQRLGNLSSSNVGSGIAVYSAPSFLVQSQNVLMSVSYNF